MSQECINKEIKYTNKYNSDKLPNKCPCCGSVMRHKASGRICLNDVNKCGYWIKR